MYLDPDILVLNPIKKLHDMDIGGFLYAAALINEQLIYEFADKNRAKLIMPDQDILNASMPIKFSGHASLVTIASEAS